MVISAPHAGKVSELGVKDGDSVDSQDLICKIGKGGGEEKKEEEKSEQNGEKADGEQTNGDEEPKEVAEEEKKE